MTKLEITFVNGEIFTLEQGTNLNAVRDTIQNSDKKFITIDNGDGFEHTIAIDKIVAMVLS